MLKLMKGAISLTKFRFLQIEFLLSSIAIYYMHVLRGGSVRSRMEKFKKINYTGTSPQGSSQSRLALFVAYHDSSNAPLSNLNYLKALLKCGFRIIYIHNGKLQEKTMEKIKPFCEKIICRENIGQDFGAWKDAYLYTKKLGSLAEVEWLLLCNDSNFFVGGVKADEFSASFTKALDENETNLIALNINLDLDIHFQSFFLCFKKSIFGTKKFEKFWREYMPLNHRHHAIQNGEIKLSKEVLIDANFNCLYNSNKLLDQITMEKPNMIDISKDIPQILFDKILTEYGNSCLASASNSLTEAYLLGLLSFLDNFNTSHAFALLFFKYLKSPFLKKDLVKSGSYSYLQIASALKERDACTDKLTCEQILKGFTISGNPYSFAKLSARRVYRKGLRVPLDARFHYIDRLANKRF